MVWHEISVDNVGYYYYY